VLPLALAAGIWLQLAYPGDFGRRLAHGGPAFATWFALWGSLAGIVLAIAHWDAAAPRDANALTPGLVAYLRRDVPERAIVFGDLETSYRMSAYAPVYVSAAPPTHVADTKANNPKRRRRDWLRFLRTG